MVYTGGKLCDWCTEMSRARSLLFTRKKRGIPLDRPVRRVIPGVDRPLGQSRQRAWQLRRRAEGMCMNCGKPATTPKGYCQVCQDKRDSHERNRVRKQHQPTMKHTPTNEPVATGNNTFLQCRNCNLIWDMGVKISWFWNTPCPQCGCPRTNPVKHIPTNEPVATGKHSIGLGAESVASNDITKHGYDPLHPVLSEASSIMVRKAVIKQRLEALRDKWMNLYKDNLNEDTTAGDFDWCIRESIKDCANDLQKEIDLLP